MILTFVKYTAGIKVTPTTNMPNAMFAVAKNGVTIGSIRAVTAFQSNVGTGFRPRPERLPVKIATITELGAIHVILILLANDLLQDVDCHHIIPVEGR